MTATSSTSRCQHQDREDLIPVDDLAARVDREHPVAVTVERDPEVGSLSW